MRPATPSESPVETTHAPRPRTLVFFIGLASIMALVVAVLALPHSGPAAPLHSHPQGGSEDTPCPAPASDAATPARLSVSPGATVLAPQQELVFLVQAAETLSPVPHAQVFARSPGARLQPATLLGLTDAEGMLRVDRVGAEETVPYLVMSDGACAAFQQHSDGIYRALVAKHATIAVTTVMADGTPVPNCKVFLSRTPLQDLAWTSATSSATWLPVLEDHYLAVYTAITDPEGRASVRGLQQGEYFWRVTHDTSIPWGNNLRATLQSGGSYTIVMQPASAAVLVVRGDVVVSSEFAIPASAVHQRSLPGAIHLQKRLLREHNAALACIMPDEALETREIVVRCYLRYAGATEVRVPFRSLGPGFSPFVLGKEEGASAPVRKVHTASISIEFRAIDGSTIPPPPWSLHNSLRNWRQECNDGSDVLEVPPGQYVVVLRHQALRLNTPTASANVGPGESQRITIHAPPGLARCRVRLLKDGRLHDDWDGCTLLAMRDGQVVESVTGIACRELWLPPGQYVLQAWVPGFVVPNTVLDVSRHDAEGGASMLVADLLLQAL